MCAILRRRHLKRYISGHESVRATGCLGTGKNAHKNGRTKKVVDFPDQRRLPWMENRFQAKVYVMALLAPRKELPDPGIDNAIKIFRIGGIPRFNGRNLFFAVR